MTPIPARSSSLNTIPSFAQKKKKEEKTKAIPLKFILKQSHVGIATKRELGFEEGRGSADVLIWFNRKMKKSI